MMQAQEIIHAAEECIGDRAASRDQANGARSMARCVRAFNGITGHNLTTREGWKFMVLLKLARACTPGGRHNSDDYVDGCAYFGLAGEEAEREEDEISEARSMTTEDEANRIAAYVAARSAQVDDG